MPILSGIDAAILSGLKKDGVYVTTLEALGIAHSDKVLTQAQSLSLNYKDEAHRLAQAGREFILTPAEGIVSCPDVFRWGLDDRILNIVEAYLGVPVAYDGVQQIYTVADGKAVGPRRWHLDWEDRKTVKVAIYCNDVSAGGGPFQVVRRRDQKQNAQGEGYRYELADDEGLKERLGSDYAQDILTCEGPAGTVVFCETAEFFHRGQPAHTQDRAALFYSYFARRPRHPFLCERSGLTREQIAMLSKGLPEKQRAAALWRQDLPLPYKFVRPSSV